VVFVTRGDLIVRRREPGDSIYFVLSGSARARILVGGEEKLLNRIPAGEFLGEMSMFTQTVRSADVVAEEDARLLKFTAEAFQTLIMEHPAAAAPMLYGISSTMARRILATNNKYQSEVASGFVWR
jgi:CRP-like cAMP-binding protein